MQYSNTVDKDQEEKKMALLFLQGEELSDEM